MAPTPGPGRGQLPPINFEALARALLDRADTLVPMWLSGGARRGHEWVCGSLDGGTGSSCQVNLTNGRWADFAGDDKGGDLVALYAAIHGLDMVAAALRVAREEGLEDVAGVQRSNEPQAPRPTPLPAAPPPPADPTAPGAARADAEGWRTLTPVPAFAPPATFKHLYRQAGDIVHTAAYRMAGQLLGYVVRFSTSDGGKETLPYTWCTSERDGASRWHWRQWDVPRPLFVPLETMPASRTVVVVEGEMKAELLQDLLERGAPGVYLVVSWPGGCKAWKKVLWDWLAGCTVLLWPDCDAKREPLSKKERAQYADDVAREIAQAAKPLLAPDKQPGMAAMLGIGGMLREWKHCSVQLLPIPAPGAVVDGWDCKDAIKTDGWDFARVLAFFAGAQPLPAELGGALAGAGGAGKPPGEKIDGPADAQDGNDAAGAIKAGGKVLPRWLRPYYDADKGRWLTSRKLVIAALENDTALADVLALNELSNNIDARLDWPWLHGKAGSISGAVDLMLGDYLTRTYGLPSIARQALMEAIETVSNARRYHPVREYLELQRHDGVTRIDKWLVYAMGETPESVLVHYGKDGPRILEYLTLVGRYWLLGMVNRVMQPGCKFDYCPVLEGVGGLGKSTMVETLATSKFFSDAHFELSRGKEGQEQVQGRWLYELAELANFGKAEIGLIKSFISCKEDHYRPSYGRVVESYPRQCVLVGTTNENTYLRDRSGNRRFWPIPVRHRIKLAWLAKFRDQLLAEAYALYQQGAAYTPSPADEQRLFVPMQESRLVETAVVSEMVNVLTRPPVASGIGALVNGLTDFVTISQLTLALGLDAAKSNAALESQIRSWLDHEGWLRSKRMINGARAWGYTRPDNWPPFEVEAPAMGAPGSLTQTQEAEDAPF